MFIDRIDAGEKLCEKLEKYKDESPIVLAIPRGGVITAYPTIMKYGFEFDLIIPRKIGLPHNKEIAIGAVSFDGTCILNQKYIDMVDIPKEYIREQVFEQTEEIKRRMNKYKGNIKIPDVNNKTVIIIDDGIATGFTIQAAIQSIKNHNAKKIVLAVPIAPEDTISKLQKIVDDVICLVIPYEFYAVSQYYKEFEQTTDDEVINIIQQIKKIDLIQN